MRGIKKIVRAALAAAMVCVAALMCTGCIGIGGSGSGLTAAQSLVDTWELYYIEFPEGAVYAEDAGVTLTLAFDEDGTCTMADDQGPIDVPYTLTGDTVEVDGVEFTIDGDYLTGTYRDGVMCFRRV